MDTKPTTPPFRPHHELQCVLELSRLYYRRTSWLSALPRGNRTVLLIPGYNTGDFAMAPLKQSLQLLGHSAFTWGMGKNRGRLRQDTERLTERVASLAQPVTLLGWSLGGLYAREVAHSLPGHVSQVITLGTAVVGGPKYTAIATQYARQGFDLDTLETKANARAARPIRASITAVYSNRDKFVCPNACIDPYQQQTKHVVVGCSHFGLPVSRQVHEIVARALI